MWFFDWFSKMFFNSTIIFVIDFVAFGVFLLVSVLAFFLYEKQLYLPISAVVGGVAYTVILSTGKGEIAASLGIAGLLIGAGLGYIATITAFIIRAKIIKKRAQREEMLRKLKFTLPDRNNSFIQARLNTVLQPENQPEIDEGEKKTFRLEHAKQLLSKVKEAPLSKAERLEIEELSKLFNAYLKKYKLTSEDVRLLNEMFAYLLKMSAKYSV